MSFGALADLKPAEGKARVFSRGLSNELGGALAPYA
jgi:hypothetical protein